MRAQRPRPGKAVQRMRLIVGLGNPGLEYVWTPHNLGFLTVDLLADRADIRVERPEARALVGRGKLAGGDVLLAKPQTMMNLSGLSVRDLLAHYELGPADLLLVYDEVALPWGMIRIRERGTAGGHNGMKSVIGALGTDEFVRVRLGVQPEHEVADLAAYVLRPMRKAALEVAAEMVDEAADAVGLILQHGVATAMNRFNKHVPSPASDGGEES
jgi:PTH1 family peptidyl-tRNA hydrolase